MQEFLKSFPTPVMAIDGASTVLACSRKMLTVFGLRSRDQSEETPQERLTAILASDGELADQLALVTAQLSLPGDSQIFVWTKDDHSYEVRVFAMEESEEAFMVLFEDETEHLETELILSRIREYMDNVLKNIPLGIAVLNSELRINFVTARQLQLLERLGLQRSLFDAVGATLTELLPGEMGSGWHELCSRALTEGLSQQVPRQSYPAGAGDLVLSTSALPLPDSAGLTGGVMLVTEDVTETTRLEQEVVKVGKLATIGQLVITVNHEINNPLSIITSSSQALRLLNPDLDQKVVGKLLTIEEQVKRISAVTERLRSMEEVDADEYIASGPQMIDVWKKDDKAQQ